MTIKRKQKGKGRQKKKRKTKELKPDRYREKIVSNVLFGKSDRSSGLLHQLKENKTQYDFV